LLPPSFNICLAYYLKLLARGKIIPLQGNNLISAEGPSLLPSEYPSFSFYSYYNSPLATYNAGLKFLFPHRGFSPAINFYFSQSTGHKHL
jgi:hypothetical protein